MKKTSKKILPIFSFFIIFNFVQKINDGSDFKEVQADKEIKTKWLNS